MRMKNAMGRIAFFFPRPQNTKLFNRPCRDLLCLHPPTRHWDASCVAGSQQRPSYRAIFIRR
jgi:hypothetical protein